jgi:hypothetical protein
VRKKVSALRTNKKAPGLSARRFSKKLSLGLPTATAAASAAVATASAATTAAVATATTAAAISTTAAAVASATAAASTPATAVAAATTWWASLTWASFVHGQWTTFDGLAIELADRLLRICVRRHRDECEAARFSGKLILHQRDLLDWPRLSEKILKIGFGRVEGKISYV